MCHFAEKQNGCLPVRENSDVVLLVPFLNVLQVFEKLITSLFCSLIYSNPVTQ